MNNMYLKKVAKLLGIMIVIFMVVLLTVAINMDRYSNQLIERIKAATILGNLGDEVYSSGAPFNKDGVLRYSDLSKELRERIKKEDFNAIKNYFDAQQIFNKAYKEVVPLPQNAHSITQPILIGNIWVDGRWYNVNHKIIIGYDYYIKPVIIEWYIDIEAV